jgi:hypothetical protein
MLKAWKRADASPTGPDDYSLIALRHAVASKGGNLAKVLGDFGAVIAEPNAFLSEGAGHFSASVKSFTLQRHGDSTGWKHFTLDHLSYAPMVIKPSDRVRNDARLKIDVDGPPRSTSPTVRVLVINSSGTARPVETLRLNRNGVGSLGLGFSPNHIRRVIVTPANVSTDFRKCYRALTQYSCFGGIPVDENKHFAVKAVVH